MTFLTRRDFLKSSAAASAGMAATLGCAGGSKIIGANDTIRVGVIGVNSKGGQHVEVFHQIPGVRVVALCDVDRDILVKAAQKFADRNETVKTCADGREILDDKDIDVAVIATPNHWHSLWAIWAIQAGKDVYVEKPVCHNIWEGRQLVKAARKYNKIVQAGTQNRSDVGIRALNDYIKEGPLGEIQWVHGLWYKMRGSIGKVNGPQKIPNNIDYDLWIGPAALKPLTREHLHYDWHWFWDTGNGDMGNLGVHQIDDCRFISGVKGLPRRVMMVGGRFAVDDDAQTPNSQFAVFDYKELPIIIEVRNLPMKTGSRAMDHYRGVRAGNIVKFENGYFAGGRGGGWVYDNDWEKVKQFPGDGGGEHQANFIQAVRQRSPELLHADVLEGHISSSLCHIANISYRLGKKMPVSDIKSELKDFPQAVETTEKLEKHVQENGIDPGNFPFTAGPWLTINNETERFEGDMAYEANMFLSRNYREPFVVPEQV
ncbi:Gfo/Idh/MocA family oxidoreductase [candidate division KSB1 bacterium]|nr:Gfo/Idh/MocA family oxidoreductase [candidate division KSB1 bacterium]